MSCQRQKYKYVLKITMKYNLIIGWDFLEDLGILLDSKHQTVTWDEITVSMMGSRYPYLRWL